MNVNKNRSIAEKYQLMPYDKLVEAFNSSVGGRDISVLERECLEVILAVRHPPEELKYTIFMLTPSYYFDLFGQQEFLKMESLHDQFIAAKFNDADNFAYWCEQEKVVINE